MDEQTTPEIEAVEPAVDVEAKPKPKKKAPAAPTVNPRTAAARSAAMEKLRNAGR